MQLLILTTDYPSQDNKPQAFVHSRSLEYLNIDGTIDIHVLSFAAQEDYEIDGVSVITLETYERKYGKYHFDLLISHAPNIRQHIKFIKKYGRKFANIVFFFHGHEILKIAKYYPAPYTYMPQSSILYKIMRAMYDEIKLYTMRRMILSLSEKAYLIFVSQWMKDEFIKNIKIRMNKLVDRNFIIYNSVAHEFEVNHYHNMPEEDIRDFVTIRSNWDKSKYCIDVICRLARCNPERTFTLYGKGIYFDHNDKPQNMMICNKHLDHQAMLQILNKHKCALMPSRLDSQGVMACEMSTYGIPLITSDLPVLREVFAGFNDVFFIDNDKNDVNLSEILEQSTLPVAKKTKFFASNTVCKEIELFRQIVRKRGM